MIAWGDVPTWLGVAAATAAGIAALWQLSLQRRQLREQQHVLAQRVLIERQELYTQLIEALREWDHDMRAALESRISGKQTEFDTTKLDRKAEIVHDITVKIRLLGAPSVAEQASRAEQTRLLIRSLMTTGASTADVLARLVEVQGAQRLLIDAMRNDLGVLGPR